MEGGDCIPLALEPINETSAAAEAGVVEDKRGDSVGCKKLLHAKPVLYGFSDAVADEHDLARGGGGANVDGVEEVGSAEDGVARDGGASGLRTGGPDQSAVSEADVAADEGNGDGE